MVQDKKCLGQESVFEFKYVPDLRLTTERGEAGEVGVRQPGIERRGLTTLIVTAIVLIIVCWFNLRIAGALLRLLPSVQFSLWS